MNAIAQVTKDIITKGIVIAGGDKNTVSAITNMVVSYARACAVP
jgi:septal ring factor EnvC (AmiA/AmiB activator)